MAEGGAQQGAGATNRTMVEDKPGADGPPAMVTFPDAARRRAQSFPPPLKLETEESADDTNSHNMWQVYALGGFLILRWIWSRWRERKNRGESNEGSST
ncbi:hypothetical protein Cni_G20665 [Canna indica]|uniref:Uncharacterized protein n=1 Tax=Canna indica TaxID=4628 RepID=A0AAQ3QGG5_9LILI|nr:hypothetical protein Cni_G20665 [Canna indica]